MAASYLLKIVAAFAAGILVALASALLYMRFNDQAKYQPPSIVIPPAVTTIDTPSAKSDGPDNEQPDEASAPPAVKTAATPAVHKAHVKTHPSAVTPIEAKPVPQPVQIAQNSPLPPPAYAPQTQTAAAASQGSPSAANNVQPQAAVLQQAAPPPLRQPNVVTLPAGTGLMIRLGETLSTDHNYSGDTFRGTLDSQIVMDGFIIAEKGSKVLGRIVNADKGGHLTSTADLSLALGEIHTTDGQTVRVETSTFDKKGPKNTASNAEKIGGGAALGAIIGAIAGGGKGAAIGAGAGGAAGTGVALATHGKAAILPAETRLTFQLATPVTITEKLN